MKKNGSIVISGVLLLAGTIFLYLSIFGEPKQTSHLTIALGCIALANLINLLRVRNSRKAEADEQPATRHGSAKAKKIILKVLMGLLVLVVLAAGGICLMFGKELAIISSITKHTDPSVYYMMDFQEGYYDDEVFSHSISSDSELADFLAAKISHGFYKPGKTAETHIGCSTLSCVNTDGSLIWGRNFDWYNATPIIVRATPRDGYASISTCEFANITGSTESAPEDLANKFLAVAAYYVPMDGVNEKGLCVAQLEVNEGGQIAVDTGKPNITVTMATRLLLNKAATVDEAIALLKQYDVFPSGGISSHLSIADASGKAVAVEFMNGEIVVVETPAVTNFNMANGDITAGGESAMKRYRILANAYASSNGIQSVQGVTEQMQAASQSTGKWMTRWTLVYEHTGNTPEALTVTYYWAGDFAHGVQIGTK